MKNITRRSGIVTDLQRMKSSINGNPRFSFVLDGYKVCTAVDSSHGYCIENFENKLVEATIGTHYGKTTLNTIKLSSK